MPCRGYFNSINLVQCIGLWRYILWIKWLDTWAEKTTFKWFIRFDIQFQWGIDNKKRKSLKNRYFFTTKVPLSEKSTFVWQKYFCLDKSYVCYKRRKSMAVTNGYSGTIMNISAMLRSSRSWNVLIWCHMNVEFWLECHAPKWTFLQTSGLNIPGMFRFDIIYTSSWDISYFMKTELLPSASTAQTTSNILTTFWIQMIHLAFSSEHSMSIITWTFIQFSFWTKKASFPNVQRNIPGMFHECFCTGPSIFTCVDHKSPRLGS